MMLFVMMMMLIGHALTQLDPDYCFEDYLEQFNKAYDDPKEY